MLKKLLLVGALVLVPVAAHAETMVTAAGPRVGLSVDPDQLVVGGQLTMRGFARDWSFDPNLELGFGDHEQVIALNLDGDYHFRMEGTDWRPYLGGGLGVNFISWDAPPEVRDHGDTEVGLNVIGGFSVPSRSGNDWFVELRFGIGDIPTMKVMGGVNFRM